MGLLTTKEVADRLGISQPRVYQLISEGKLPSQQYGRTYLIDEKDLKLVQDRPKVGRPSTKKVSGTDSKERKVKVIKKGGKK